MPDERPCLVVVTSTYPRWLDDNEPRFTHDLARHLTPYFRVVVVAPSAEGARRSEVLDGVEILRYRYAPKRFETLVNNGGIVGNLRRSPWKIVLVPTFVLSAVFALRSLAKRTDVAVVHAHWIIPGGVVAAMGARGRRFVVTAHGSDVFALRGRVFGWIKRLVLRKAAFTTCVSEPMAQRLLEDGASEERIGVLPMGTDVAQFHPDSTVSRDRSHILFVGRLIAIKGCDVLLRVLANLTDDTPDIRLSIVGDGPARESLERLAHDLGIAGRVTFHGAMGHASLIHYYRAAGLLVWPSVLMPDGQQEGLGMVVPEAMACGCPVLASDQPSIRWLFRETGVELAEPGSVADFTARIRERLKCPDRFIAADTRARDIVVGRLDWQVVAKEYARVLNGARDV